ncbi:MAG: potassium-transporting ATPase subunit C [Planctomycetes bacterium]|nr:potassium-transporting ATPase subunit C [Planctomycetota bacterium]
MIGQIRPALVLIAAFTAMTVAYTLAVTAIAMLIGPSSTAHLTLEPAGAATFSGPEWFHGRPSAATGGVSGGSNLGPTNPTLAAAVAERVAAVRAENPAHAGTVPVDLVTASGSGFDPHISPPAARLQIRRVAANTGLAEAVVRDLVERTIEPRTLGVLGHPRVNVVTLNAALRTLVAGRRPTADAP